MNNHTEIYHPLTWLTQASPEQIAIFCQQNATLITLLTETWQTFQQNNADIWVQAAFSAEPYAPNISLDDVTHSPISPEEMAEFARAFDRQRGIGDRPFGDDVVIHEHDWHILDDAD